MMFRISYYVYRFPCLLIIYLVYNENYHVCLLIITRTNHSVRESYYCPLRTCRNVVESEAKRGGLYIKLSCRVFEHIKCTNYSVFAGCFVVYACIYK